MHRLTSAFVLGYHGCDESVGKRLLSGEPFRKSDNTFDWLGPGVYFWEANPHRAFEFALEASARKSSRISKPFVVGAILDLRLCLDLTTRASSEMLAIAYGELESSAATGGAPLPVNSGDLLRRYLDCAVIRRLHSILEDSDSAPLDSVKGVFTEGDPVYPGAGFLQKTHIQLAICNTDCIQGVFRLRPEQYKL